MLQFNTTGVVSGEKLNILMVHYRGKKEVSSSFQKKPENITKSNGKTGIFTLIQL